MTDLNEITACESERTSEGLTDTLFAPSYCFNALLKAFKDPEYQDSWLSEFADRIAQHMRFVGQTSADMPLVYGEIRAIEAETKQVLLEATFYWAQDEKAFFSHGYPLPTEDFIPVLRDDEKSPLLRIRDLSLDQDFFFTYAHEGAFGKDDTIIEVKCVPVEAYVVEQ